MERQWRRRHTHRRRPKVEPRGEMRGNTGRRVESTFGYEPVRADKCGMLSYQFSGPSPSKKDSPVKGTLLARCLGFPEGPVIMPDGSLVFCDGNTGELLQWKDDEMSTFAVTGGSPWGALLGTDGAIYVTQGGDVPAAARHRGSPPDPAGQPRRLRRAARVQIAGHHAGRAERSRVRQGRPALVHRVGHGATRSRREVERAAGALYVLDPDGGEFLIERPGVTRTGSRSTRRGGCTGRSRWHTGCAGWTTGRRRRSAS